MFFPNAVLDFVAVPVAVVVVVVVVVVGLVALVVGLVVVSPPVALFWLVITGNWYQNYQI